MGVKHFLFGWGLGHRGIEPTTSRVIRAGEPPEYISVIHADGAISEVRVSADNDELTVHLHPALQHPPHLSGGYI